MTAGLTYNADLVVKLDSATGDTIAATNYHAMTDAAVDPQYDSDSSVAFQIKFADAYVVSNLDGHTLYLLYSAKVNANAITDTGRENEVTIKYDNTHYSVTDKEKYEFYTGGAVKYDGATADVDNATNALTKKGTADIAYLRGAEFKLQVKNGNNWVDLPVVAGTGFYRPAVTGEDGVALVSDANGAIIIRGLDKDKQYQLVETKAPDGGYNLASTTAVLDVTTKDDKTNVGLKGSDADTTYLDNDTTELSSKIANNKGDVLPSTGGIGTTIFYVAGIMLVLGAAAVIIARRNAEQN